MAPPHIFAGACRGLRTLSLYSLGFVYERLVFVDAPNAFLRCDVFLRCGGLWRCVELWNFFKGF